MRFLLLNSPIHEIHIAYNKLLLKWGSPLTLTEYGKTLSQMGKKISDMGRINKEGLNLKHKIKNNVLICQESIQELKKTQAPESVNYEHQQLIAAFEKLENGYLFQLDSVKRENEITDYELFSVGKKIEIEETLNIIQISASLLKIRNDLAFSENIKDHSV